MRAIRLIVCALLACAVAARAADFPLAGHGHAATLCVDPADATVVGIAADCLAGDIQRVTGIKPEVRTGTAHLEGPVVLIGSLGHNAAIDALVRAGRLDVSRIRGQWESYTSALVANPMPGVDEALVIAGSDRRGAAYGVFDLSERIGVSPWVWWSDVKPAHQEALVIDGPPRTQGPPSVKYRGIFLNDEDWSLQPWAAKTFEPETGDIGPKTYARVCELLLRLKANYLWPAMHKCTRAFNTYPQNKIVADNYAIVMGSSHAEPMLRDNVTEWDPKTRGEWDYEKNRDGILQYWEERVKENGHYENTYTIGMRGIHDSPMPGGGTVPQKVARLQQVIDDQRAMLARDVPGRAPQIFVPYKEVLTLYQNGLKVPDDVTLVWPDDNHGYIRELSTPAEQQRPGGAGVYYHVSYYGAPADYLWLCTTPPALIWEEMHKAYNQGAQTLWVLNVGGLKKSAIDMDFFLRLAWNIRTYDEQAEPEFLNDWARQNFGADHAPEIAAILREYYDLNGPVKPEHLLQVAPDFSPEEKAERLRRFAALTEETDALYAKMPAEQRDAFYELVVYQVRCSALQNEKFLGSDPMDAYQKIQAETKYYNETLAGGKWNLMMSANPRKLPVFAEPAGSPSPSPTPEPVNEIDITKPSSQKAGHSGSWIAIAGLGRSGNALSLWPLAVPALENARLEYDFQMAADGPATVSVYCLPTHSLYPGLQLRYSASLDGQPAQTVDIDTVEFSKPWAANVLRGAAIDTVYTGPLARGAHQLILQPLDPGVVFDQVKVESPKP